MEPIYSSHGELIEASYMIEIHDGETLIRTETKRFTKQLHPARGVWQKLTSYLYDIENEYYRRYRGKMHEHALNFNYAIIEKKTEDRPVEVEPHRKIIRMVSVPYTGDDSIDRDYLKNN